MQMYFPAASPFKRTASLDILSTMKTAEEKKEGKIIKEELEGKD